MNKDSIVYDSLDARPLPKWLTDQRDGLNAYQPPKMEMKEDHSLQISLVFTSLVVVISVVFLTIIFLHRNKKKKAR
jgi:heme/copper-type cytochrome/quinol oxidase subunit 2